MWSGLDGIDNGRIVWRTNDQRKGEEQSLALVHELLPVYFNPASRALDACLWTGCAT